MPAVIAIARGRPRIRGVELVLLLLGAGIVIAAVAPLPLRQHGWLAVTDLAPALVLVGLFLLAHATLMLRGRDTDQVLLPLLLVLTGLSYALTQRLAADLPMLGDVASRQLSWIALGLLVLLLVVHLPYELRLLRRYRYTWALVGIVLVGLTLVAGRSATPGGPRLWLGAGGLLFQPSELLKLLLVVFLAGYLEDRRELLAEGGRRIGPLRLPPWPYLAPLALMLGLSLVLLAAQGDLGAALLMFAIALGMLYLASSRASYVLAGLALFAAGAWGLHHWVGRIQTRVAIWLDPWSVSQGSGYQLVQSLMALAAGGVTGTGLGFGEPTAIPAVHTDFVYAAVAEELGGAGAVGVLTLYALLALRGYRIAVRARGTFRRLLAAGLTFALAVQTFIIIGGVVKLIPLTGITLPFLSYGGTSMLTSSVAAGLLLRLSETEPA